MRSLYIYLSYFLATELRPLFDESSKICFSIGNLSVRWYAVLILSGALIGTFFGYFYYAKRLKMSSDLVAEGLSIGLFLGILFARLYYVIFSGVHYSSFWEVISPRNGGLAIHGGIIAVILYLPIWTHFRHIKLLYLLEIALPLIMFAQVVGRWGNFVNQEAFGPLVPFSGEVSGNALSDAQLLEQRQYLEHLLIPKFIIDRMYIPYSSASGFSVAGYYQPTFLYESVLNFVGLTAYQIVRKFIKQIKVGDGLSFYLIWYGGVRIFIESLRSDPLMLNIFGLHLRQAIVISVIMIIAGIFWLIFKRLKHLSPESCREALYGEGSTIMKEEPKRKKARHA